MANSPIYIEDDSPPPSPRAQSIPKVIPNRFSTPHTPLPTRKRAFVEAPHLATAQKQQYKSVDETFPRETRVDEVIGEYRDGTTLYYFARYAGGIAYKYPALSFVEKHKDLVDIYKKKKAAGTLDAFNPSGQYVHPLSRVRVKIRISSDQVSRVSRSDDANVIPDSEDDEDEDEDDKDNSDDDEYDGPNRRNQPKRATRAKTKKDLPFSPRKSRSRKILTIGDSESNFSGNDSVEEISRPTRRSTRGRKATEIKVDDDDYEFIDDDSDDGRKKAKAPKGKKSTRKSVIPMYGHFRDIKTLDDDPFSDDEENEDLRRHRQICEKCHLGPAHKQLAAFKKKANKKGKKRRRGTDDEFEESDNEEKYHNIGGWVQCLKCPVAAHWNCLASTQRDEVLRAVREVDRQAQGLVDELPRKRKGLEIDQITEFICGSCTRGGICLGCMETAVAPDASRADNKMDTSDSAHDQDIIMKDEADDSQKATACTWARELLFRCFTCKRLAHYNHLPKPHGFEDASAAEIANHYQTSKSWLCADCASYQYPLDKIIAWRPYPANAVGPPREPRELPNYKTPLPREYLVKWEARSYRRLEWVPHMWLLSTHPSKLKNFIATGPKVDLLKEPTQEDESAMDVDDSASAPTFEKASESRASSKKPDDSIAAPLTALPDAERRIPLPWKTIDRVLDVNLWRPKPKKAVSKGKKKRTVATSSEDESGQEHADERRYVFEKGEQPPADLTETVDEWEAHHDLSKTDIDEVAWAFIKWEDLGYDEATWDAPPRPGEPGYEAFKRAFERFLESRTVVLPKHDKKYWDAFDSRSRDDYQRKHRLKDAADLDLGQPKNLKLMPFQVDGFNWLCNNWWNRQHCILADEMGLGKTVQIATFLGNVAANWRAFPALVVVPNSTLTNWVREFERWAPKLRVVPFYGEKNAREVIKEFELYHKHTEPGNLKSKFHVLVTTYETLTNSKDCGPVFKNQPRWEVLVIDEVKSDTSLLFRKLNELNSVHRIIMTGTPLNNNIRELFNLMNFLDPDAWSDLEALEKQYEVLSEELVKDLHNKLRPYFLRRIKSEVLQLPPKNEVIVPISMAPLQREVYRSILSNNLDVLNGLSHPSATRNAPAKTRINNVLMQLRKCLQHPYLYAEDIEPRNLPPQETHEKLIDASGKLRFLKALLRQLKERGHRVLLFSQFVIALNVIEDFLQGEGIKFLRLDGGTKGADRQKAMDAFNKPGSDYFVFLLTTRAGGVGINLFTADTVIIFDPDFNPHQDLQAIARAYRYGQKKTCLVFKLMVKDSAEERIMQVGKKKLVLDHLIVQKMDDDEDNGGENVQSILTYGAQALFDDTTTKSRDITYTDQDIEKLIEKTEKEAVQEAPKAAGGLTFAFAKVWAADKDSLEEVVEEDQGDSWALALQKINEEKEKEQSKQAALSGRGARRRAADIANTKMNLAPDGSTIFDKKSKNKAKSDDGSAWGLSNKDSDSESDSDNDQEMIDDDFTVSEVVNPRLKPTHNPLGPIQNTVSGPVNDCGLCGQRHSAGDCSMVERSENLAEYREMLILHADDEPWESRSAAVQAIDEILQARGHISLIVGQPLHPLPKALSAPSASKKRKSGATIQAARSQPTEAKKPALMPPSPCLLCESMTPHYLKNCSAVLAGSKSISKHIQVLESQNNPTLISTINTLRNLLAKAKSREMANRASLNGHTDPGSSAGGAT